MTMLSLFIWLAERYDWFNERFCVIEPDDFTDQQVKPYLWMLDSDG